MSCINLLANDIWSDADIVAHGRAVIESKVSKARQIELQTILLGQMTGMRVASQAELDEIVLVQSVTEAQAAENDVARAEMALLLEVMAFEADPTLVLSPAAQAVYELRHPIEASE
jgi:hypothetical protein